MSAGSIAVQGRPEPVRLPFMLLVSILGHCLAFFIFIILPQFLPHQKIEPFGGPSGSGGNVMTVDFGLGEPGKPAPKPVTQEEPAPSRYIAKTTKEPEIPLESKTDFPELTKKKKPKDEPTAKATLNQPERKTKGEFGTGKDMSENAGKSGTNGKGKFGVGTFGIGQGGPGGYGTGTGTAFPFPWYIDQVLTKLEINWAKPFLNETEPREYTSVVYFVITRNGEVKDVKVEQSSGIPALDRSAESAVLGSTPFPPLPSQWTQPELAFRINFTHTQ